MIFFRKCGTKCSAFSMPIYTQFAILSYLTVILAILLFQIVTAIVSGKWKHKLKSRLPLMEIVIHVLIIVLSASFSALIPVLHNEDSECNPRSTLYIILATVITSLFVIIILLVYLCGKYSKTHGITKRTKWLLIEFSVMFVLLLAKFVVDFSLYQINEYYTLVIVHELDTFLDLVIVLVLTILVYLPDIHYCKRLKGAPDQRPLLVNSGTQHTNPASVWDHANVPSYTVYNPPPEMTDCVTDTTHKL